MTVLATIDHEELALSRVAHQYTESPNFLAYIRALMAQSDEIEALFLQVATITDIDVSEGVNLDVIGAIVGLPRTILQTLPVSFFGFSGQTNATRFGEEGLDDAGSRFREESEPNYPTTTLADPEYRAFLRARIARNHSIGTLEDVAAALKFIFDARAVIVEDIGGMAFNLSIAKRLTYAEQTLLYLYAILPKPAAVRISQRTYFDPDNCFGFEGFAFSLNFGEETQWQETVEPIYLDGTWTLDGSEALDGERRKREFVGPGPMIGGVFAEETNINL